jgi:hypothetical protein
MMYAAASYNPAALLPRTVSGQAACGPPFGQILHEACGCLSTGNFYDILAKNSSWEELMKIRDDYAELRIVKSE